MREIYDKRIDKKASVVSDGSDAVLGKASGHKEYFLTILIAIISSEYVILLSNV